MRRPDAPDPTASHFYFQMRNDSLCFTSNWKKSLWKLLWSDWITCLAQNQSPCLGSSNRCSLHPVKCHLSSGEGGAHSKREVRKQRADWSSRGKLGSGYKRKTGWIPGGRLNRSAIIIPPWLLLIIIIIIIITFVI